MSELAEAPQEELQAYFEEARNILQFGLGHFILSARDNRRNITYQDETPIMHGAGYFYFCSGDQIVRHAPEAADVLDVRPHYELEFHYTPARHEPRFLGVEADETTYDTTKADNLVEPRVYVGISSEHSQMYFVEKNEENGLFECRIDEDLSPYEDMDGNPRSAEDIVGPALVPEIITPKICDALGAMISKLAIIDREGKVDDFMERKQRYENSSGL